METKKTFVLEVEKDKAVLSLREGSQAIDTVIIGDGRSLAEKLLPAIDDLLRKYALKTEDIAEFKVQTDLPEGYSARRIAETVAATYRFACSSPD